MGVTSKKDIGQRIILRNTRSCSLVDAFSVTCTPLTTALARASAIQPTSGVGIFEHVCSRTIQRSRMTRSVLLHLLEFLGCIDLSIYRSMASTACNANHVGLLLTSCQSDLAKVSSHPCVKSGLESNTMFLRSSRVSTPSRTSIRSAAFAQQSHVKPSDLQPDMRPGSSLAIVSISHIRCGLKTREGRTETCLSVL